VIKILHFEKGILKMNLLNLRIIGLVTLLCILFSSFYHLITSAETTMCENGKVTCKGTEKMDVLIGNKETNKMNGLQGSDYILGLSGNDNIIGDNGTDSLIGGTGDDVIDGGGSDDTIIGNTGNDNITGGLGADEVIGGEGNDTILGGLGPDTIIAGQGNDYIVGGHGADEISGGPDDDIIYTSDRNTTESDGAKDIVNCGEGIDNAWINTSIDKDEVSTDCEFIHRG
jgi:Ca2+-binding RTX toxin-like protein